VIPLALPIGAAHGIATLQPASTSRIATLRSYRAIGEHLEAVLDQDVRGFDQADHVGLQRVVVGDHFQL